MNETETTKDESGETGGVNLMKNEPQCRLRGLKKSFFRLLHGDDYLSAVKIFNLAWKCVVRHPNGQMGKYVCCPCSLCHGFG